MSVSGDIVRITSKKALYCTNPMLTIWKEVDNIEKRQDLINTVTCICQGLSQTYIHLVYMHQSLLEYAMLWSKQDVSQIISSLG